MKRSFLAFLVLIIISALVLGFGYAPLRVQADAVGILYSRTSGWSEVPIDPSGLDWRWELLVPTNATIYQFGREQQTLELNLQDVLPSADLYAQHLEGRPSLRATLRIGLVFMVKAEAVAGLASQGVRPEGLADWYGAIERELEANVRVVVERIVRASFEDAAAVGQTQPARIMEEIQREVLAGVQRRIPEIELQLVVRDEAHFPDFALYRAGRDTYLQIQAARSAALATMNAQHAVQTAVDQQRLETLERYGRLFTTYPVLLEYLDIVAKRGADPLNIEALRTMGITIPAP